MAKTAYTSILIPKEWVKRLKESRDQYKLDNKEFGQMGLASFYIKLLDFYEANKE